MRLRRKTYRSKREKASPALGAALLFLFGFLAFPHLASGQYQELFSRAADQGTVHVIVHLRGDFAAEGELPGPAAALAQRQVIAQVQDRVLARIQSFGATRTKRFRRVPFLAMEVDSAGLSDLASNPDVIAIEEDIPVPPLEIDGRRNNGPTLQPKPQPPAEDIPVPPALSTSTSVIGADDAWSAGFTGAGRAVAILDTGVEKTHSFFSGRVISEACFSSNFIGYSTSVCPGGMESSTASGSGVNCDPSISGCDHGTHVAGIAAGNGSSFSGVAKDADIIAIQVFSEFDCSGSPCILSWTSDQILALERVLALKDTFNIASVNMSLGGSGYTSTSACDAANTAIKAAIDNLRSLGIATVIASGNNGYTNAVSAPGCISSAVSVGSTNNFDAISWFSNEAPFVSLYAPGESILSSVLFDQFATKSGTSMATPHVTGAWAILKQKGPDLSVDQILTALRTGGVPLTSTLGTWTTPRIDVGAALDAIVTTSDVRMYIDLPAAGATVAEPFVVAGWAIDLNVASAPTGASSPANLTGVDLVEVWATPVGGAPPTFLGNAALGFDRPDVGAAFGDSRFDPSGFQLTVNAGLSPGDYSLQVKARSIVTGTFDISQDIPISVGAPSNMSMYVDAPTSGATVTSGAFPVVGWVVDLAASSGTGVDGVTVTATPSGGGSPIDLGTPTLGIPRPDVGAFVGSSQFDPSGFFLDVKTALAPGSYTLTVSARSTVTGTFDIAQDIPITVALESTPWMYVDVPVSGAVVTNGSFSIFGWALDLGAPSGTGVDTVTVIATPSGGGSPTDLGTATYGTNRPDVGAFFGSSQFDPSGFALHVTTLLAPGDYTLTVSAHSTVAGSFNNSFDVAVTVP